MKKTALISFFMISLFCCQAAFALSLTLENQTGKVVHELYFAPAGEEDWGPDQLGDETIEKGDTFTLTKIAKGKYDVMFVDELGAKCDIRDVDFTSSELFVMTKKIIKGCQAATEQEEGEEE